MRRLLVLAAALAGLLAPSGAQAADDRTGRLLVTLERPAGARAAATVLARASARRAGPTVPQIGLVTVRPTGGLSVREVEARLRRDPAVRGVELERRHVLRATPDDPALVDTDGASGLPAGTPVQWWAGRGGFTTAWDTARAERGLVGVIDTGAEAAHPELAGRIAAALDHDATAGAGPADTDQVGHGTHVGSLACAVSGNGVGIAGAGHSCRLVVAKTDLGDASIAASIVGATDRGAHAINMSFGTTGERPAARAIVDAIRYAADRDVVVVAAAADEPTEEQGDPANVLQPTGTGADLDRGLGLSVTAATFDDTRAHFAGRGSQISLAAYGTTGRGGTAAGLLGAFPSALTDLERGSLVPPAPACNCRTAYRGDSRWARLQGTSMAAPLVAGAAALVRTLNPDLGGPEVVRLLKQTARRRPGAGWSPEVGWGILDAGAAVEAARRIDRRAPTATVRAPRRTRRRAVTVRLRSLDPAPAGLIASGVRAVEVWRARGGGRPVRIARTRRTRVRLRVHPGTHRLWAVAVDRAGNRQARPARPHAVVRVLRRR